MQGCDPLRSNGRQGPNTTLIGAVGIQHSTSEGSGLRVLIGEVNDLVQSSFMNDRVGVQDQNVLSAALPDADVIRLRKP